MPYDVALSKAWGELQSLTNKKIEHIIFLAQEYAVDIASQRVFSRANNVPAKDYLTILITHYLIQKLKGLPQIQGEWISFQQLPGGQGYYPSFKKRVIDRLANRFAEHPEAFLERAKPFNAAKAEAADLGINIEVFHRVAVLITLWPADEEFGPQANIHFDRSIKDIFCTEDIVVMSELIVSKF